MTCKYYGREGLAAGEKMKQDYFKDGNAITLRALSLDMYVGLTMTLKGVFDPLALKSPISS